MGLFKGIDQLKKEGFNEKGDVIENSEGKFGGIDPVDLEKMAKDFSELKKHKGTDIGSMLKPDGSIYVTEAKLNEVFNKPDEKIAHIINTLLDGIKSGIGDDEIREIARTSFSNYRNEELENIKRDGNKFKYKVLEEISKYLDQKINKISHNDLFEKHEINVEPIIIESGDKPIFITNKKIKALEKAITQLLKINYEDLRGWQKKDAIKNKIYSPTINQFCRENGINENKLREVCDEFLKIKKESNIYVDVIEPELDYIIARNFRNSVKNPVGSAIGLMRASNLFSNSNNVFNDDDSHGKNKNNAGDATIKNSFTRFNQNGEKRKIIPIRKA